MKLGKPPCVALSPKIGPSLSACSAWRSGKRSRQLLTCWSPLLPASGQLLSTLWYSMSACSLWSTLQKWSRYWPFLRYPGIWGLRPSSHIHCWCRGRPGLCCSSWIRRWFNLSLWCSVSGYLLNSKLTNSGSHLCRQTRFPPLRWVQPP